MYFNLGFLLINTDIFAAYAGSCLFGDYPLPWRGISLETLGKAPERRLNLGYFHCFTIQKGPDKDPQELSWCQGIFFHNFYIFTILRTHRFDF